jgi:hypothetical protein
METEVVAEIDLFSRLQKMEYTTFVEQAVIAKIEEIKTKYPEIDAHYVSKWAGSPGQVTLRLFRLAEKRITLAWQPSEEPLRRFVSVHSAFFYEGDEPLDFAVEYLWPVVDELRSGWPGDDYYAAGKKMQGIYRKHGKPAPEWPPAAKQ